MSKYKIEQKISTLAECRMMENKKYTTFKVENMKFEQWEDDGKKQLRNAWLVTSYIEAENYWNSLLEFNKKLRRLIPKITLVSQSYIEHVFNPLLIHKENSNIAIFEYTRKAFSEGLVFNDNGLTALKMLLGNKEIPEGFYLYWKDATNTAGYSSKLLLIFSALEALAKKNGKKDWVLLEKVLGKDLKQEIFAQNIGLRNRLVHGEYFNRNDFKKDYVEVIHKKIIHYFNTKIFKKNNLIEEDVKYPQRHFLGNKGWWGGFCKRVDGINIFSLKELLADFDKNPFFKDSQKYKLVFPNKAEQDTY